MSLADQWSSLPIRNRQWLAGWQRVRCAEQTVLALLSSARRIAFPWQ
jgi:hypothetical protein